MGIAALITWVITALGGFYMLGIWIQRSGILQQQSGTSRLPAPVVFGHFVLAASGLVVRIIYVVAEKSALVWTSFGLLLPVALLGFVMLVRRIPAHRDRLGDSRGGRRARRGRYGPRHHRPTPTPGASSPAPAPWTTTATAATSATTTAATGATAAAGTIAADSEGPKPPVR
ncbi:hypothetical protein [Streptomyces sp. TE5632]